MRDNLSASSRVDAAEAGSELECLPYSVQHHDEGVCLLVKMGPHRILLDCGLEDISSLTRGLSKSVRGASPPLPADLVLVSHAHPDHARGLLALHNAFPKLPIYGSEVTSKLLPLNWQDQEPQKISQFCHALPLRSPVEFQEGLVAELFPAGHLPGQWQFSSLTLPNIAVINYCIQETFSYPIPGWWKVCA